MAFANGLSERMGELRFPNPKSPNDDTPFSGYVSPPRGHSQYITSFHPSTTDTRANLQRRFTTDSSKISTIPGMSGQNPQFVKSHLTVSYEKKRQQIEQVREQKRKFEAQMKLLDLQEQRLQQSTSSADADQLAREFAQGNLTAGPVSEPTTPPDYSDAGFPTSFSRPDRYSISSITSPPGLNNRYSQSSAPPASSPSGIVTGRNLPPKPPAKSMPGSRRNSEDEEYLPDELASYRSTVATGSRYSMPTSGTNPQQRSMAPKTPGLGPLNTTSFLFDDNDDNRMSNGSQAELTSPNGTSFFQMTPIDDNFPTLRSDRTSGILSANSAALDLANSRSPDPSESWAAFTRPRPNHQSMPQAGLNMFRPVLGNPPDEQVFDSASSQANHLPQKPQRHSMGLTFTGGGGGGDTSRNDPPVNLATPSGTRPVSLQSSFSMSDLPTVKNSSGTAANTTPAKPYTADQHFHNHNASLGRIPPGAASNRQSRDFQPTSNSTETKRDEKSSSMQSLLQASAAPFGPQAPSMANANMSPGPVVPYGANLPSSAYGYSMQSYNMTSTPSSNQLQTMQAGYGPYAAYGGYGRLQDTQPRAVNHRRQQGGSEAARYDNVPIENYQGRLYELCKDQHGCRYLQKRLEEQNPEHIRMIFAETCPFVVELMTDPFGNYLCQKLLEYSDDEQRTELISQAAPAMVSIALNQHGTRALQKMVEHLNTPEQIGIIVMALKDRVVELVQDLNGNHVIQKCLNKLGPENSPFIFEAVGRHCVIVGTHRHGCCVLQRCIDHAKGAQRAQLIASITSNAFSLVQDPFGNYVVQYILDLDEPMFTKPLCANFAGNIPALSKQKFSSNVIEKCLRTADMDTKRAMIEEMLHSNEIEKMLRDSFANYVVQTAMDYADPATKLRMVDTIRPILPAIKQTPHGRRIASKILGAEGAGRGSGTSSGQMTPNDPSAPPSFARAKSSNTEAVGRRQFQVYGQHGIYPPVKNGSRFFNPGFPDGLENNNLASGNYAGLNTMGIFANASGSDEPHPYSAYSSLQPGPGYI